MEIATDCNALQPLDERQRRAVDMLATGMAVSAIAKELGVDRTTLWRWRRDAAFAAELNGRRDELWQASTDRFRTLLPRALDVLEQAMNANDVRTALTVVKIAGLGDLRDVGPTDVETIIDQERRRQTVRERARDTEQRERTEAEVRRLEDARELELRRLYAQ